MKYKHIHYKGFTITYDFYGRNEYTVFFEGDDVWFNSLSDAKSFIDSQGVN